MNSNFMSARKHSSDDDVLDPLPSIRKNRDAIEITVVLVAIAIVMALSFFCAFKTSTVPPMLP
ncbi:MAG TPA: hypothetical protein VL171_03070 [Verrucomicrobiae bacterium]|nr:hypothetical protein [Verrucomicrobiae bacterium]